MPSLFAGPPKVLALPGVRRTAVQAAALTLLAVTPVWAESTRPTAEPSAVPIAAASKAFAATQAYDIAAGALGPALSRFAGQSGITLSADPVLTEGLQSPGLRGSYGVLDGFAQLLQGTGLAVAQAGENTFVLRRLTASLAQGSMAGAATLAEVQVTAQAQQDARTDGTGSYTAGPSASATGLNLSLRDTPQAVTVITRQQMDDQGSAQVADVMRQAPGITVQTLDSERWGFSTRGFSLSNFQYNGVSKDYDGVYDWGATNSDMAIFDRVEIVKGATGLMSGTGDPSATANFVRKLPTQEFSGSVTASAGSWRNGRTEVDLSGPLNASGSVRGRVVGAYQDRESFLDHYRQKKSVLYGVVEADLAADTRLTVGADYQSTDPRGSTWTGFPMFFSDGSRTDWSRSFNPATTWSQRKLESNNLFATLEQGLVNNWHIKLTANHETSKHRSLLGSASGGNPDPLTGEGMYFFMGDFQGNRTQNTVNASLSGPYTLLGRTHEAMLGAMWSSTKTTGPWSDSVYPMLTGSIFDWNGAYPQPAFPPKASYRETRKQTGVYGATRLRPSDALSFIVGARLSNVDSDDRRTYYDASTPSLESSARERRVLTPYAGAVYDLDGEHSLYASYTSIFSPQSMRDANRQFLSPVKGKSWEAGVKAEYLQGRLNASLTAFRIQQDNVAEYVDMVGGESIYRAVKGVSSKGVEAEVSGQLTPGWNVQAAYSYAHVRNAQGEKVYGSTQLLTQPAQTVRLSSSYRLPGDWSALTIGGGISWQSATWGKVWNPVAGDYARIRQPGYALLGLMAQYRFSKQLSASLHVKNLLDKKYYAGMGLFETGFYGEPRNATLSMRYQF